MMSSDYIDRTWPKKETDISPNYHSGRQPDYQKDIVQRILRLQSDFTVARYGVLSVDPERFPLYYLKNINWSENRPIILLTGGVHGQDCSGIAGMLRFLEEKSGQYTNHFNLLCLPCVNPRSYESTSANIQDPKLYDPDRHFYSASPCEESSHVIQLINSYSSRIIAHFDLQEATQTSGMNPEPSFSLVADTENPQYPFQKAIIQSVRQTLRTSYLSSSEDEDGGCDDNEIRLASMKALRRCNGLTSCYFRTTTRICPESLSRQQCNEAQIAAITGGLDFILNHRQ